MTAETNVPHNPRIHPGNPVMVDRYSGLARLNHWITATGLILLVLSGLALFHPAFFFLTVLFGGGQLARMLHPWIGAITFLSFAGLFLRFWSLNLWNKRDSAWISSPGKVLSGDDEGLPEDLLPRLDILTDAYRKLIEQDVNNKVLGEVEDYYQLYSHQQLIELSKREQVAKPSSVDEWMIPVAKYLDLNKVKFATRLIISLGIVTK